MIIYSSIFCQKVLYGINVDKDYPQIKNQKEIKLKDNLVFSCATIQSKGDEITFSIFCDCCALPKHPPKNYGRVLIDLKKIFGQPINIYSDSNLVTKESHLFIWKSHQKNGYFFVLYNVGMVFIDIVKENDEEAINNQIAKTLADYRSGSNWKFYINGSELNMKVELIDYINSF